MEVVRATESHIAGIAAARLSNGPAHDDSGANADYCRYLIADGHLFVAVDDGDVLGFGGAIDVGAARLLSDLYVHREAHGRGVGSALLAAVMGDSLQRLTFASNDPAALPLYARAGMVAWWPLLAVSGARSSLRPALGCDAFDVSVHQAAEYELVATHLDRSATYRYWAGRSGARTLAVERDGRRISFGDGPRLAAYRRTERAFRRTPPPHYERRDTQRNQSGGSQEAKDLIERGEQLPFMRRDTDADDLVDDVLAAKRAARHYLARRWRERHIFPQRPVLRIGLRPPDRLPIRRWRQDHRACQLQRFRLPNDQIEGHATVLVMHRRCAILRHVLRVFVGTG